MKTQLSTARGQLTATGWDDDDNNRWMQLAHYTYLADGKVAQVDPSFAERHRRFGQPNGGRAW